MRDLYAKMGSELRSLFKVLFDPKQEKLVRQEMTRIMTLAEEIGGSIREEAALLNRDVLKFLQKPNDQKLIAIMKEHAMRLEHETREL